MNSDRHDLAARLKKLADDAGGTAALARICEMPQRTMANYVDGKTEPRATDIVKIAKATNVLIEWLLTGVGAVQADDKPTNHLQSSEVQPLEDEILEAVIEGLELSLQGTRLKLKARQKAKVVSTLYGIAHRRQLARLTGQPLTSVETEMAERLEPDVIALIKLMSEGS